MTDILDRARQIQAEAWIRHDKAQMYFLKNADPSKFAEFDIEWEELQRLHRGGLYADEMVKGMEAERFK